MIGGHTALGDVDPAGALIVGMRLPLEVAEALERPQQVVQGLLRHPQPDGELRRPRPLRPRVLKDRQVGGIEVVEAVLVQPREHPVLHLLERDAQERADQRWAGREPGRNRFSKAA